MLLFGWCTVPKLRLREQCFAQDICADVYAQCIQGVCACVAGSREVNNTCREYFSLPVSLSTVFQKKLSNIAITFATPNYCFSFCITITVLCKLVLHYPILLLKYCVLFS